MGIPILVGWHLYTMYPDGAQVLLSLGVGVGVKYLLDAYIMYKIKLW